MNRPGESLLAEWKNIHSDTMRIQRILVPVDFSVSTAETLRYAKAFASEFDAVIHLLHVVGLNIAGEERGVPRASLIRDMSEAARKGLSTMVETLWSGEIVALVAIRVGRPHEVILQEARNSNADLIIIGTTRHDRLLRLFRQNTVSHVVRRAPCPVLVVRVGQRDLFAGRDSEAGSRNKTASIVESATMHS